MKRPLYWLCYFIVIYYVAWVLKSVVFSVYTVPTPSMHPTINSGDFLIVSKMSYRIRTPEFYPLTNLPFPFYSIKGPVSVKPDDIVVFKSPLSEADHPSLKMTLVKRCVGLPGDTLWLVRNRIYTNHDTNLPTGEQKKKIIVPRKNMTVEIDSSNIDQWLPIIERDARVNEGSFSKEIKSYTFTQNFYFMTGDNPGSSADSRSWGSIPEENLIGRARMIVWSVNRKKIGSRL